MSASKIIGSAIVLEWKGDKIKLSNKKYKFCPSVTNTALCLHPYLICFSSYLALVAGLASEADFIFIPEEPAVVDWPVVICDKIVQV